MLNCHYWAGSVPKTPFVSHLGSPHGPKHRSAQTDGPSGQLSRGRAERDGYRPVEEETAWALSQWGLMMWAACFDCSNVHIAAVLPETHPFTVGTYYVAYNYKNCGASSGFNWKNKTKKKLTKNFLNPLSLKRVLAKIQMFLAGKTARCE